MSMTASASIGREKYQAQLEVGPHLLIADEPISAGGGDLGPAPGDYLRLALAACTTITLRMYSDRKHWNVDKIKVDVTSESVNGKTIFQRSIHIEGSVDEAQRKQLLKIANACPVHKVLTNPIEINTDLLVAS